MVRKNPSSGRLFIADTRGLAGTGGKSDAKYNMILKKVLDRM